MNLISKKLLGGLLVVGIVPATLLLTSCSTKSTEPFDHGIDAETQNYYGSKISADQAKATRRTMLITAGGRINDKSFNQSAWESMQLYKTQAGIIDNDSIAFRETDDDSGLPAAYDQALSGGYKTWVLTSFQQATPFKSWLEKSDNKAKFIKSKAIVVGVDWDGSSFVPEGQFLGLGFKTQESSWVVGYAASEYLSTTDTPYLSSFGGGEFDGVTDFNNGFLQGMLDWNTNNPTKPVKFHSGNKQASTINLNTGFLVNSETVSIIDAIVGVGDNVPQITLPVSGSLTATMLENINSKDSGQMIIGVDSNQSLAFPSNKTKFFSSVEKKIAVGVYKAMILLAGIPLDFTSGNTNDQGFEGDFKANGKSALVKYGFDKGMIGYSPSTLAGEEAAKVNALLENAYKIFLTLKPIEPSKDYFKPMTDSSKNQVILDAMIAQINK